jgi:hypothetical protein
MRPKCASAEDPSHVDNARCLTAASLGYVSGMVEAHGQHCSGWSVQAWWCGVVWCGVVWCGVVWCGVVWCGVVWDQTDGTIPVGWGVRCAVLCPHTE